MSKVRLVGGIGLMLLGTALFLIAVVSFVIAFRAGPAGWLDRLSNVVWFVAYGVMATWCAVVASGQSAE